MGLLCCVLRLDAICFWFRAFEVTGLGLLVVQVLISGMLVYVFVFELERAGLSFVLTGPLEV